MNLLYRKGYEPIPYKYDGIVLKEKFMPVFISYSHKDEEFVAKFAAQLVKHNTHVWIDTWNLNVGDSLITKVQEAIEESSALLIILSKSSVESEWCKKELNSGLIRELDEKQVILLPVLIEDCKIPLFLREKMYADFRSSFDTGLSAVVNSLSKITNQNQNRIENDKYHVDWGMDWEVKDEHLLLEYTLVEQSEDAPFSVLTQVSILCNENATSRYMEYISIDLDWYAHYMFTTIITDQILELDKDIRLCLDSPQKQVIEKKLYDHKTDIGFEIKISSRRLGEDTGKDILINISNYLKDIREYVKTTTRELTEKETELLSGLLSRSGF